MHSCNQYGLLPEGLFPVKLMLTFVNLMRHTFCRLNVSNPIAVTHYVWFPFLLIYPIDTDSHTIIIMNTNLNIQHQFEYYST